MQRQFALRRPWGRAARQNGRGRNGDDDRAEDDDEQQERREIWHFCPQDSLERIWHASQRVRLAELWCETRSLAEGGGSFRVHAGALSTYRSNVSPSLRTHS